MSIEDDANCVVEKYVEEQMKQAYERIQVLQKSRHLLQKDAVKAVTQWNSWVRWLMPPGKTSLENTFIILKDNKGEISIRKREDEE